MKKLIPVFLLCFGWLSANAQTNIFCTNALAHQVLTGNFSPSTYLPSTVINQHGPIVQGLMNDINPDSLKSYLIQLGSFHNRNSGSDTISDTIGIGASRRWAYDKFTSISAANENRLIPTYLQFDVQICNVGRHKNVLAVLPGTQTADSSILIIEAHMDSRCEDECDSLCLAQGMEDNGSGCALVIELARVMSKYSFKNTIVFMLTIGEEQGLVGAEAMALYCQNNSVPIECVLNNDVIGGVICGQTASPPGCTSPDVIDSTHVRIFSYGTYTSNHKALARFSKLQYLDEAMDFEAIPMFISVMTPEDRTGRGGDHIPFRQHSYSAIRFTSAHEHGNANVSDTNYTDRQHSHRDILGVDTDLNGSIDSLYVDVNYLRRNALINGTALAMAGIGPMRPDFTYVNDSSGITITISDQTQYDKYLVHVRRIASNYDLDLWYYFSGSLSYNIPNIKKDSTYYISVSSVDTSNVESILTSEKKITALGDGPLRIRNLFNEKAFNVALAPNPARDELRVHLMSPEATDITYAIHDISGRTLKSGNFAAENGENTFYIRLDLPDGFYNISFARDGKTIRNKSFVKFRE